MSVDFANYNFENMTSDELIASIKLDGQERKKRFRGPTLDEAHVYEFDIQKGVSDISKNKFDKKGDVIGGGQPYVRFTCAPLDFEGNVRRTRASFLLMLPLRLPSKALEAKEKQLVDKGFQEAIPAGGMVQVPDVPKPFVFTGFRRYLKATGRGADLPPYPQFDNDTKIWTHPDTDIEISGDEAEEMKAACNTVVKQMATHIASNIDSEVTDNYRFFGTVKENNNGYFEIKSIFQTPNDDQAVERFENDDEVPF